MNFFLLLNTKEDILKNIINEKNILKSMGPDNCLVADILQNIL